MNSTEERTASWSAKCLTAHTTFAILAHDQTTVSFESSPYGVQLRQVVASSVTISVGVCIFDLRHRY